MSEGVFGIFSQGLQQLGLDPRDEQLLAAFECYRQELLDWNTRINLTAITDPQDVLLKHFLDSLSLLKVYTNPEARLLDIGSGAGFPGLPLKIVRPQWHVTLLEATGKKTLFLRHMVETLQLRDAEIIHGRAEELAHKREYRATFDIVTARAVSALPTLLEYCAPYCRVGGVIVFPKKGDLTEELLQAKRAAVHVGTTLTADIAVDLPGLADGRRLLVWEQQKLCPLRYPRSGSVIAKKPLA
ncbi:MAG TPA: 16S rRNA (guanine(527)-N(7))-methyltransferase RsmG [Ktedonobacteraceae bacterium]|nr:16S rRNA (guanine(527)-N(7))-methyltransferase RsmG [Ktedonobacteraceae bacterium]